MFSASKREKSIGMARQLHMLLVFLVVMVALILVTTATPARAFLFDEAKIIVEVNATDGDAGFQVFLDGEGWESVSIIGPDGELLNASVHNGGNEIGGGTELFLETAEPEFDIDTLEGLQELLDLVPEGKYKFKGKAVDGFTLVATATLTHVIPNGPEIVSPGAGEVVSIYDAVIVWNEVTKTIRGSSDIEIVGYQVIVELEEPLRVFSVDLPVSVTSVTVPPEFLEPETEYKFEVLAIEESGNQTITERSFETE